MNRDTGIRNLIPGVRFDNEIKEDLRSQRAIRNRLEGMATTDPVRSPDVRFSPSIDLKPTKILHKDGEYGHPLYWKSEKEFTDYLANDAVKMKKAQKFRQDPAWVESHNKRFPKFKTTQLPKEKQQPQYGVTPINGHDESTYAYNQKEALATAGAMDQAVANTKTRINQIHKNPASKIIEKQQSIKDLQRVTDIAYKYSNDQWAHKPEWQLDRKTGSPIDVADPKTQNDRTVKQLQNLKSWSQGGKVNAPHVKLNSAGNKLQAAPKGSDFYYNASENALELKSSPSPLRPTPQAAKKKDADKKLIKWALEESPIPIVKNPILKRVIAADNDPAAGAKYIDWWDRIETKNRT